jgi:hypothetical protein
MQHKRSVVSGSRTIADPQPFMVMMAISGKRVQAPFVLVPWHVGPPGGLGLGSIAKKAMPTGG